MRKLLGLSIVCFLTILFLCGFTSGENEFEIGKYNVDYSSEEWKEMSFQEQIDSVSLPVDYIEGLSTEDVVTWALEYPFLCDIYLFDSSVSAMDYFKRTSYLFENMFSRDDIREVLIERLEDLYIKEDSVLSKKELFIIYYLANIKDKLSDDEITKLFDILNDEDFNRFFGKIIIEYAQPDDSTEDIDITRYEGFISSNQIFQYPLNGGYYIAGTYWKYGVGATCYQFSYNDYSYDDVQSMNDEINGAHPSWYFYYDATKKYNCHSYVWIDTSYSNTYWLPSPYNYIATSLFNHVGTGCGASAGDRITISYNGNIEHSLLVTGSGANSSSIYTKSKLGSYGVYGAPLNDMMILYGNTYDVYN